MDYILSMRDHSSLKDALKRGIGYHHAGLKDRILCSVEMLFIKKYLQVLLY